MRLLCSFFISVIFFSTAFAQPYPAKPITLIIPFPPGGSTDLVGRLAAEGMSRELGQPVVVDNRGGAGGAIGAKAIADAAPDGYTLGLATVSTHVVNPVVRGEALRYDALRDFTLLSVIAAMPNVVSVHPSLPAKDMKEFLDYLKTNPGKANFGTPGSGSLGHMLGETFKFAAKVNMVHVPYKGAGPALNDALAGQVQVLFDNLPSSLGHIQAGKLRALAVSAERRVPSLPDVPTFAEVGLPMMNDPSWFGLIGPANLPAATAGRAHQALAQALKQPDTIRRLEALAATPVGNSPEQFRKLVSSAIDTTRRVVRESGLKFD
jgi:tripartite-type tricarboxylate transporter receptor subunit TctC